MDLQSNYTSAKFNLKKKVMDKQQGPAVSTETYIQ